MENSSIAVVALILVVIGIQVYVYFFRREKKNADSEGMLLMQQQLQQLDKTMREQMSESNKVVQQGSQMQFRESKELMQQINKEVNEQIRSIQESISEKLLGVQKNVSEVSESNKKIFDVGEQLQNLEKVLKHQKQRGNLGEASLQLALENMLSPTDFSLQYQFPGGETVDAVIITPDGLIPIDAKFSLDNYRRLVDATDDVQKETLEKEFKNDLKKRIDETAKYVRPKDGTLPFAFMYIPAEAIYYDLLVNEVGSVKVNTRSLIDYAYRDKNVIIVSPTTFAAYLQSVLHGFRALKIEKNTIEIRNNVEKLTRHFSAYIQYFEKVGVTLSTTVNHYDMAQKELKKIDKDVMKITEGEGLGFESIALDKPTKSEE